MSNKPEFTKDFVRLEKIRTVDITDIAIFGRDEKRSLYGQVGFDAHDNMYILDDHNNSFTVLDETGRVLRTFGSTGQGPNEFERASQFVILGDKVYVFQVVDMYNSCCKIVSREGNYISKFLFKIRDFPNLFKIQLINNEFYCVNIELDTTLTLMDICLKTADPNMMLKKELFRKKYEPGFRSPNFSFSFGNWLHIAPGGEFYFPGDIFGSYSIMKYDKEGNPLFSFGRKYTVKKYSAEAKQHYITQYGKDGKIKDDKMQSFPPVIRNMFTDTKNNLWVISDETYEDNLDPAFENTIDIFDSKGKWLYSLKTPHLSRFCIYNNGKIYRIQPVDTETNKQYMDVYQITYLRD